MTIIDTHAHYNSSCISNLNDEIKKINNNKNISTIINVGLDVKTSEESLIIANSNEKFYSTLGIHPLYDGSITDLENLYNRLNNNKIVAIGETGIDTSGNVKEQIIKFVNSIKLANELKLPIIIHSNTIKNSEIYANKLCIEIIKNCRPMYGFVFHCFQPDLEILDEIIKLGGYISVGSMITKQNAKKSLEVVKSVPIDNLLIETDYPFLTNNQSFEILNTFNRICELKKLEKTLTERKLNENAKKLFKKIKEHN